MGWQTGGLIEGGLDAVEDFQVVFAKCRDVAAYAAEDFAAVFTSKTTRDLLLQLRHPDVALTLVIVERPLLLSKRGWMRQERQDLRLEIAQSIEQVLRF